MAIRSIFRRSHDQAFGGKSPRFIGHVNVLKSWPGCDAVVETSYQAIRLRAAVGIALLAGITGSLFGAIVAAHFLTLS